MSRRRYRARRLHAKDGAVIGWMVLLEPSGRVPAMAAGYGGAFAWYRARFHAASLNRKGWQ